MTDWSDLPAVQGSAFFMVQLSHPYMTTGKTKTLTRWNFVGKVMSLLFNMLSRFVMSSTGFIKLKINISRLTGTEDEHFYHCYPINMWS